VLRDMLRDALEEFLPPERMDELLQQQAEDWETLRAFADSFDE
jgi:hypothetical protein